MSDETKPINEASVLLFKQTGERHQRELTELADMAFRVDGMDVKEGWAIRLDTLTYVRKSPEPELAPGA